MSQVFAALLFGYLAYKVGGFSSLSFTAPVATATHIWHAPGPVTAFTALHWHGWTCCSNIATSCATRAISCHAKGSDYCCCYGACVLQVWLTTTP